MPLINRGPGPFPHLALKATRFRALADDLDRIARGEHPTKADLRGAPLLARWSVALQPWPHLFGIVTGHPTVADGRPCRTSQLFTFDPVGQYARTESRLYRLAPLPPKAGRAK